MYNQIITIKNEILFLKRGNIQYLILETVPLHPTEKDPLQARTMSSKKDGLETRPYGFERS